MKGAWTVFLSVALLVLVSAGCGKTDEQLSVGTTLQDVVAGVAQGMGERYVQMPVAVDADSLPELLDIEPGLVEEFAGDYSMTMSSADCFFAVRAKAGQGEEVRKSLERRRVQVEQMFRQYLPDPFLVAKSGRVVQKGDYVFLIMLGNPKGNPEQDIAEAEKIIEQYFAP